MFQRGFHLLKQLLFSGALLALLGAGSARVEEWKTGPDFVTALDKPLGITSSAVPLRQTLENLERSQQVAIVLDRRIDPDQPVELDAIDLPLREVLERVAKVAQAKAVVLNDVVYLGPPEMADRLRTLLAMSDQQLSRLPPAMRTDWRKGAPLVWADYATPREILTDLFADTGITLTGIDALPHDLWGAISTPPLPLVTRAMLVLAQFDRTLAFSPDRKAAQIVGLPREIVVERRYPAGTDPARKADEWRKLLPGAKIEVDGKELRVAARIEEHEQLTPKRGGGTQTRNETQADIEKIRIDRLVLEGVALGQLLASLESRLGIDVEYDYDQIANAGIKLDQLVSLRVEKVSVDELLKAALEPAGLTFRREGRRVDVMPAKR